VEEGKKKSRLRIGVTVILFAAVFYLAEWLVFALTATEISSWSRKILNQMYREEKIEIGVIGGAEVLYEVTQAVIEERTGKSAGNLPSSRQPLPAANGILQRRRSIIPR